MDTLDWGSMLEGEREGGVDLMCAINYSAVEGWSYLSNVNGLVRLEVPDLTGLVTRCRQNLCPVLNTGEDIIAHSSTTPAHNLAVH